MNHRLGLLLATLAAGALPGPAAAAPTPAVPAAPPAPPTTTAAPPATTAAQGDATADATGAPSADATPVAGDTPADATPVAGDTPAQKLEDELAEAREDGASLEERLAALLPLASKFSGYVDLGAFATTGDGAGTRADLAGTYFPEYAGKVPGAWVFMGDPLSTAINARGEPADTGDSRAVVFDPVHARGKPSFLVNAVNLALFTGLGETATLDASIDFVPRSRNVSDPSGAFLGDFVDVKLAYAEWRPRVHDAVALSLFAGKFDSVLGYEYRAQESPDRIAVTPSLICRYTCGHPIGLKARARFLDEALVVNVAVTNGSHGVEGFPFADETDTNRAKTVAGRVSYQHAQRVEVGVSGAWGAQDYQPRDDVRQWHVGGDVHVDWADLELTAELVHGRARGATSAAALANCDEAPCLRYTGAYALAAYRLTNTLQPYLRVDWRDALHESGTSFVYISDLARVTVGLRAELGTRVILKAEGTHDHELGKLPQFPNDLVTTSLVIKF